MISKKNTINTMSLLFFTFICLVSGYSFASGYVEFSDNSDGTAIVATLCKVINLFTGPTGQALVIMVIITTGFSMFFGKMTWIMAAIVMIGVGIVFGAENIVNNIIGGSLHCKHYKDFFIIN